MAANNQAIAHFGPKGRAICGKLTAHLVVSDVGRWNSEPRKCKACLSRLGIRDARNALAEGKS